jgi:predicted MFS family arabinose efflux permease
MPQVPGRVGTRLDIPGAIMLFVGLLCLIGPLLFGQEMHWSPLVWITMMLGAAVIAMFFGFQGRVAAQGGMPLVDLALMADPAFTRGLCAVFAFFFANLSFYLVMTLFMQNALHLPPLQAGLVFVPLTLAFVVASRHSGIRAKHRGTLVLIEGCVIEIAGLAATVAILICVDHPAAWMLALPLIVFGYGQGFVMAPLSSAVLSTVKPASAGSGSGLYGTTNQIANAAGVAALGAVYVAVQSNQSPLTAFVTVAALFALSIAASVGLLLWMRGAVPKT